MWVLQISVDSETTLQLFLISGHSVFIHFKEQLRNLVTFLLLLANSKSNNVFLFHFEMNARKLPSGMVGVHFHKRKPGSPIARKESATRKDCE